MRGGFAGAASSRERERNQLDPPGGIKTSTQDSQIPSYGQDVIDTTKVTAMSHIVTMNLVSFCRVLGDPTRWRIIRLIANDALCVCELAEILGMPQSSVSSHVQVIRKAGLLESERREKWTYFRIEAAYLKLLQQLQSGFNGAGDPIWETDDQKTSERLAEREDSWCPGPVKLASRRRGSSAAIS